MLETAEITPTANSRFVKARGSCFYDSEILNSSFVHLLKLSAEIPHFRKVAKYLQHNEKSNRKNITN